jgi:glycine/D-amino acid oxidase-like deaminating enzyme
MHMIAKNLSHRLFFQEAMTTSSDRREIVIIGLPPVSPFPFYSLCFSYPLPALRINPFTGAGIIGCTTAYFLTRHPLYDPTKHHITLLEASKIAGGASGKAGGLLALWAYPRCIVPLSYQLHTDLAKEHGGAERWGYRKVHCGQVSAQGRQLQALDGSKEKLNGAGVEKQSVSLQKRTAEVVGKLRATGIPTDLNWFVAENIRGYDEIGTPETTAQVHPYQFTTAMADLAQEKGVKVVLGSVTEIGQEGGKVRSVTYTDKATREEKTIKATDVIISAGPRTKKIFPSAPISALRAHSVTIRPSRPVSAYAVFTEISLPTGFGMTDESVRSTRKHNKTVTPEMYARPNDEVYACGEGDTLVPLPALSEDVETDDARCQDVVDYVSSISDEMRDGEVLVRQACYLPNVEGAVQGPFIGETGVKGLLMAAGHTCWGIQNGPGTGKLMAEFVFDGKAKSASIKSLDPRQVL